MNVQQIKLHAPQFLSDRAAFRLLDQHATRWLAWVTRSLRLVTRQHVPWLERIWQRPFLATLERRSVHHWQLNWHPTVRVYPPTAVWNNRENGRQPNIENHSYRTRPTSQQPHHNSGPAQTYQMTPAANTQLLTSSIHHNRWLGDANRIIHRSNKQGQPQPNRVLEYKKLPYTNQHHDRQPVIENTHRHEHFIHQRIRNRQRQEARRGQYNRQMSLLVEWKKPAPADHRVPDDLRQAQDHSPSPQTFPTMTQLAGSPKATLSQPELVQVTDQVMQQIDRRLLIWRERTGRA